jgi:hypothetical protein
LTEESVQEIAQGLDMSSGKIDGAAVFGGANAIGMRVSLSYSGDEVPMCGNDMQFWLAWLRRHGTTVVKPPRVIIDGTPFPDFLKIELDFGQVPRFAASIMDKLPNVMQQGGMLTRE